MTKAAQLSDNSPTSIRDAAFRRALQLLTGILIYGVILFVSAGTLQWPAAWWFLMVNLLIVAGGAALILRQNPEVIVARSHIRTDIETWDKWVSVIASLFMFIDLAIPGLDVRFGWTPAFPLIVQALGFLSIILGYALLVWAMLNNPFFESGVRIQVERDQTVATAGPYRFIRHPGYVGIILQLLGIPLALASWWGLIAGASAIVIFIVRTLLEDRTLQLKLPGYADFAKRVRYRLLPGVW